MSSNFSEHMKKHYCVYLLQSQSVFPKYKGSIYIGFTVDPNRRLKQHNAGVEHGGAYKTNHKGPWEMVLVNHGFPHEVLALRFEWAWQHPYLSRRLKHIQGKKVRESNLHYHLRILDEMLRIGPWKRIPIRVQWLKKNLMTEIDPTSYLNSVSYVSETPGICSLKIIPVKEKPPSPVDSNKHFCFSCVAIVPIAEMIRCPNPVCKISYHIGCLAKRCLGDELEVIPLKGKCSLCGHNFYWCDIIAANNLML